VSRFFRDLPEVSAGSNNWVLAPSRSRSGKAWLANDPHLALKNPPFWYWVHLQGGDVDAIGASVPGVPLIASGASRRMAWGLTNSYLDVGDVWAVERSELRGIVTTRPWIWIRFGFLKLPFFFKTIERTRQGWPLLPLDAGAGRALVLRWSGYELASSDVEAAPRLMAAADVRSMDEALSRVGIPSWNFVFADTAGGIGYRAVGKVPRREGVPEWGVLSGTPSMALAPTPWLAVSEMPHVLNPARGFVATAKAPWASIPSRPSRPWKRSSPARKSTSCSTAVSAIAWTPLSIAAKKRSPWR
jgi:penicillin amidase